MLFKLFSRMIIYSIDKKNYSSNNILFHLIMSKFFLWGVLLYKLYFPKIFFQIYIVPTVYRLQGCICTCSVGDKMARPQTSSMPSLLFMFIMEVRSEEEDPTDILYKMVI